MDEKIIENNLSERVFSYSMDMNDPDFANEEFDIVFCEAAIDIIGFKRGLTNWRRLLKPKGYMVVSDITWIGNPSSESRKFWNDIYSEVDTIENKISQISKLGFEFVDYVVVPKEEWKDYHKKLERNLNSLSSNKSAKAFSKQIKKEIERHFQSRLKRKLKPTEETAMIIAMCFMS